MARCVTTNDGYVLVVLQTEMGSWCGYVGLPDRHPWHGVHYNEPDVSVHGGLTYAEQDPPPNALVSLEVSTSAAAPSWWLGFDCAHAGDFVPGLGQGLLRGSRVWTLEDTWREAENLLAQARAAAVSTG